MRSATWLPIALLCLGCQMEAEDPAALGELSRPIIGGTVDRHDPAVVQFGGCTGTLIADRVVLTAAHCVSGRIESGQTSGGDVRFGSGFGDWIGSAPIADMIMHRHYSPPAFKQYDIALLRLGGDPPEGIRPVPLNVEPLDESHIGLEVKTVGFGNTDGEAGTGFGTKRKVRLTIEDLTPYHIVMGTSTRNTCQGDSGGPTFARLGGEEEKVIAVTSFGPAGCTGLSSMSRTDAFAEDFLLPVLDAWTGPCPHDGVCDEACEEPDPDCDVCALDGVCSPECESPDLDCPLGGLDGDFCDDRYDCESRHCIEAPEDPRVKYCSRPCEPGAGACPEPTSACAEVGGETVCTYPGQTPSTQGAGCDAGEDCRSGVCDPRDLICIERCGNGLPACPEDLSCQDVGGDARACRLPAGGCAAAGGGWGEGGSALLLFAALVALRRRR